MNEIKVFKNEQFGEIRTITIDGQPWLLGKDVADALRYSNTQKAVRDHVDEEDKLTERIVLSGQNREVIFVNESGLYSLILKSKLPSAKQFKRWVTSEVLPSIRKYGAYATEETLNRVQGDTEESEKLFRMLREEKQRARELENEIKPLKINLFSASISLNSSAIVSPQATAIKKLFVLAESSAAERIFFLVKSLNL